MDIARDYLARGRYADAIDEFLLELGDIECVLGSTMDGMSRDVIPVLDSLRSSLTSVLLPTAASLDDTVSVTYFSEALKKLEGLSDLPAERAKLPDLLSAVTVVRTLGELIAGLSSRLADRIASLETGIREKAPKGYDWGPDEEAWKEVSGISGAITDSTGLLIIRDRMSLIKRGPSVVNRAASAFKHYSVVHELLINYANIEYLLEEKLGQDRVVGSADLPVARKYAGEYLELYRLKHQGDVYIEKDTGRLTSLDRASLL
jgi:hypothetical protein